MPEEKLPSPPEANAGDIVVHVVKAGINAIPLVGGAAAGLANILGAPLDRRLREWFELLAESVRKLQEQASELTDKVLKENEAFHSAAVHALQSATRTHQKEKLEALRNAVLNVAAGLGPEEDQQMMFLQAVDRLTVSHIVFLRNRASQGRPSRRGGLYLLAKQIRPPGVADHMLAQIVRDLKNDGFLDVDIALDQLDAGTVSNTSVKLTEYGSQFLSFITSPLEEERAPA